MDASPEQSFNSFVDNLSNRKSHVPKNMTMAYTANPFSAKYAVGTFNRNNALIKILETYFDFIASKVKAKGEV